MNSKLTSENLGEVYKFFNGKDLLSHIITVSPNIPAVSLYKISQNAPLANLLFCSTVKARRYFELEHAIAKLNNHNILIGIDEVSIYLLFDNLTNYLNFMTKVYDAIIHDPIHGKNTECEGASFSPRQIILSFQSQKIIFRINGTPEDIELARKYCEELFGVKVVITTDDGQKLINIAIIIENLDKIAENIMKIQRYINTKDDDLTRRIAMHAPREFTIDGKLYIMPIVTNEDHDKRFDIVGYLGRIPDAVVVNVITVNNTINGDNGKINNMCSIKNKKSDDDEPVKKWITDFMEVYDVDEIESQKLYDTYKSDNPNGVSQIKFSKIMTEMGYKKTRDHGVRKWICK